MKYTNLKRIAQTVILLLCTLGIAVTSFCFAQKEAEASERADIEEIMTDKLIRELFEREQWKSAFCRRKALPVSEGQMQEFCDALEILKVEREIKLREPYAEAYYDFLKGYFSDRLYVTYSGFRLVYIDGDEIPELLIMEDHTFACGVKVYTYYDNSVTEIGEFGSMGEMLYLERQGKICSYLGNRGEYFLTYYVLDHGKAEKVNELHSYTDSSGTFYEIDGAAVTEEVFRERNAEVNDYMFIGYYDSDAVKKIIKLKPLLAREIENLKLENDLARQQAEAIEAYGDFSGEHGGEWKNFLKDRVLSVSECSEDEILRFEYDDFNGDGNYEAFVFLGKEYEVYDEIEYDGSFWFVSAKQCIRLDNGMRGYRSIDGSMSWGGNQKYVYCITGEIITANISRVWTVRNGKAVESKISGIGEVRYDGGKYLEIVRDAYDGVYDQYSDIMNGHTYKPYFYKYNWLINEFEECKSGEIDEEELERLCGFDLGAEIKAEGYEILSILKLENNILVVNYAIHDEGEFPCINYENVMWDCTTGDYWKKEKRGVTSWKDAGFGGTYQKSK